MKRALLILLVFSTAKQALSQRLPKNAVFRVHKTFTRNYETPITLPAEKSVNYTITIDDGSIKINDAIGTSIYFNRTSLKVIDANINEYEEEYDGRIIGKKDPYKVSYTIYDDGQRRLVISKVVNNDVKNSITYFVTRIDRSL